jgi:transcriptional regulator with XRE-family HTH domain
MDNRKKHQIESVESQRDFIGMTRAQLCERANIAPSTYYRWRKDGTGKTNVKKLKDAMLQFAKENKL